LPRAADGRKLCSKVALFPRWSNAVARLAGAVALGAPLGAIALMLIAARSPLVTGQGLSRAQPVPFDHRRHAAAQGLDCRYCHTSVEGSSVAGIPPLTVCLGCHGRAANGPPGLEPLFTAFSSELPIPWVKVNDLPDFVYFDHSIHLAKGVGCTECHGRVDQMAKVRQAAPLTMSWCLDCHRDPGPHLRPKSELTNMQWAGATAELSARLLAEYDVRPRESCDACHR
jgi:hypothetical protein